MKVVLTDLLYFFDFHHTIPTFFLLRNLFLVFLQRGFIFIKINTKNIYTRI